MKIIGVGENDKYVVSVDEAELIKLSGRDTVPNPEDVFVAGKTIPIGVLWDKLKWLRDNKARLQQIGAGLRTHADQIDAAIPGDL